MFNLLIIPSTVFNTRAACSSQSSDIIYQRRDETCFLFKLQTMKNRPDNIRK
jgi:hypothetical protein